MDKSASVGDPKIYVWYGQGSTNIEREYGLKIANYFKKQNEATIVQLEEGEESNTSKPASPKTAKVILNDTVAVVVTGTASL